MAGFEFHFDSRQLGKLARDFERADRGSLPRMRNDLEKAGREVRDEARTRFIDYAASNPWGSSRAAQRRTRISVIGSEQGYGGFKAATGIYEDEHGVYSTVGQTWFRTGNNSGWSTRLFKFGLEPVVPTAEYKGWRALDESVTKTFRSQDLY